MEELSPLSGEVIPAKGTNIDDNDQRRDGCFGFYEGKLYRSNLAMAIVRCRREIEFITMIHGTGLGVTRPSSYCMYAVFSNLRQVCGVANPYLCTVSRMSQEENGAR